MSKSSPRAQTEPIATSVEEFARRYGLGRTKAFDLIRRRELQAVKVGRRTLVPIVAAEAWFASLKQRS